MNIHVAHTGGD